MSELYLICHKVSGEPAFDVAIHISCPECRDAEEGTENYGCEECDQAGYWWIIPTSGHRAYPVQCWELRKMHYYSPRSPSEITFDAELSNIELPPNLPDHYPTIAAPDKPKLDLAALMKSAPIRRRA